MDKIKVLFLAADPCDSARLRLGQELRDIRDNLNRSKHRDIFLLESRESVRPGDITQAIFDVEPQIIHFAGHGMKTGELCFEDIQGKTQPVQPEALANLFELVSAQVSCVVLNACYSEIQARAIAKHIPFVIGMNQSIGDKAAVTFAIGFYKALGAGRSFEDAHKFARVEIQLEGIPEHLTPVLQHELKREPPQLFSKPQAKKGNPIGDMDLWKGLSKLTGVDRQIRVKEWSDANGVRKPFDMGPQNYQRCLYDLGLGGKYYELEYTEDGSLKYK